MKKKELIEKVKMLEGVINIKDEQYVALDSKHKQLTNRYEELLSKSQELIKTHNDVLFENRIFREHIERLENKD